MSSARFAKTIFSSSDDAAAQLRAVVQNARLTSWPLEHRDSCHRLSGHQTKAANEEKPIARDATHKHRAGADIGRHGPSGALRSGGAAHRQGDLAEAEDAYLRLLSLENENPHVRHSLGVLRAQQGRAVGALAPERIRWGAENPMRSFSRRGCYRWLGVCAFGRGLSAEPHQPFRTGYRATAIGTREERYALTQPSGKSVTTNILVFTVV
jgi:hypothetical protein